ncbi:MAG: hypothetical protein IPK82_02400 [Polyangiaceae bacterium]|nr:hypothetical protein [Polyangiaceae bacterium]
MSASTADAQEILLTGPLAGAPAVRKLRLHREGRIELAPTVSFTLLDEYQRHIIPGLRVTYHPLDWLGFGVWGGYGFGIQTNLADELQKVGIEDRRCADNPSSIGCFLTEVNLTRAGNNPPGDPARTGTLGGDQLGAMTWFVAPEVTAVPFRGKIALFASVFADADIAFFAGPAFVGLRERKACGGTDDNGAARPACADSFSLTDRVAIAPTFGLRLNFYATDFVGFGAEFRGFPFSWNTAGFDNHGTGQDNAFPDQKVDGADSEFKFNTAMSVYATIAIPTKIKTTE